VKTPRHFLTLRDIDPQEFRHLIQRGQELKAMHAAGRTYLPLQHKVLAMVFEKSSTRTRVSFEAAMVQFGGSAIFLSPRDTQLGRGEPVADTARVLSRMVDAIMVRTFAACLLDFQLRIAVPEGYEPEAALLAAAGERVQVLRDPRAAVTGADLVVTDVWASMGQEEENNRRRQAFQKYQVNEALMETASPDALFMHCLPAHRGEEVSAAVIDGPRSVVWDEAENRLHAQKALLEFLLAPALSRQPC